MITVLKIENGNICGWIHGKNLLDASREAESLGLIELAKELRSEEYEFIRPGKFELDSGYILLST